MQPIPKRYYLWCVVAVVVGFVALNVFAAPSDASDRSHINPFTMSHRSSVATEPYGGCEEMAQNYPVYRKSPGVAQYCRSEGYVVRPRVFISPEGEVIWLKSTITRCDGQPDREGCYWNGRGRKFVFLISRAGSVETTIWVTGFRPGFRTNYR